MLLRYFHKKRNLTNTILISILLPYLLLCLTMGGFHNSISNSHHCNHTQHQVSGNPDNPHIAVLEDVSQHNAETCQICQWLKLPSVSMHFLLSNTQFDFIYTRVAYHSNPVLPSLSIHKFTIRPPPAFSC